MTRAFLVLPGLAWAAACSSASAPLETACAEAEERLGRRVCVHEVRSEETWQAITFPAAAIDQERTTTYLVPARDDARVPPVFVDAGAFDMPEQSLHHKFLTESFVELEALQYEEYVELVLDAERREWFAG